VPQSRPVSDQETPVSQQAAASRAPRAPRGYGRLLLLVLAAIVTIVVLPDSAAGTAAVVVVLSACLVVALKETGVPPRRRRRLAMAVGLVALLFSLGALADPVTPVATEFVDLVGLLLALTLAFLVPVLIARDLLRSYAITVRTLGGTLCVYLLLGLGFASTHLVIQALVSASYSQPLAHADAVYLSFVTLTTVGFGDITPTVGAARAVAVLEAVVGQLYLVSVVALVIGNLGSRVQRPDRNRTTGT
jgi:hypothetical protein